MGSQISTASGQTWTLTSYLNDLPGYTYEKRCVKRYRFLSLPKWLELAFTLVAVIRKRVLC